MSSRSLTSSGPPGSPAPGPSLRADAQVITLVGAAHLISHFSQLLLAPLFPLLKEEFGASYAQLGFLVTLFFVVSCTVQAASGFLVDRLGPRPVLFTGLGLLGLASIGYALSPGYWALALCAVVAGVGNGVFHPVDYTLLNRKVSPSRLGHGYSVHGITGSLGWALAPALVVPLAYAYSWRVALACAGLLAWVVLLWLWLRREHLTLPSAPALPVQAGVQTAGAGPVAQADAGDTFSFLTIPAVWMCFAFFLFYAMSLGVVQAFAPEAAAHLHGMPVPLVAVCLTAYMVCSAAAMVGGGFLAGDPRRCERVVGIGFGIAALVAVVLALAPVPGMAVPVLFGLMGACAGMAGPSRDMLVKRSTPVNATGRVYGVVYSGLDIGQAVAPLIFGLLMDEHRYQTVLLGLALVQAVLIASAFQVRRVRREVVPRVQPA